MDFGGVKVIEDHTRSVSFLTFYGAVIQLYSATMSSEYYLVLSKMVRATGLKCPNLPFKLKGKYNGIFINFHVETCFGYVILVGHFNFFWRVRFFDGLCRKATWSL
jgi:hypothetical protein